MTDWKLTFLGTGTSTGVPQIGCRCGVCSSDDPRDHRLRTSALLEADGYNLLLDCGPDFRQQMLRCGSPRIDAVAITHSHYDHTGGLDDLRPYAYGDSPLPIHCSKDVALAITQRLPYCFGMTDYPGVPRLRTSVFRPYTTFRSGPLDIMPLDIDHGRMMISGFRIGPVTYITDCHTMPPATLDAINGTETLVINALRIDPHPTHMNLQQAIDVINAVRPRKAYLTHMSHHFGLHADMAPTLPQWIEIAYDGLQITATTTQTCIKL